MAIDRLAFTAGWDDSTAFPTHPDTENDARAMLQLLHNETRDYINALLDDFEATLAAELGFAAIDGLTATKVRAALIELLEKYSDYVPTSAVETTLTDSTDKVPSSSAVVAAMVAGSLGDMLSAVYVGSGATGKVAAAENSDKLGGTPAADYATKEYVGESIPSVPTAVSELENDSGFQTQSGTVTGWKATNGTTYLLYGVCTAAQYAADSGNTNRDRTMYLVPLE